MEKRSLAAIDADLALVRHEISLAEPHRQQCPEVYAALAGRREELEWERDEVANPSHMSRLPPGYRREEADASGVLPGEGVQSDAQPIRVSGHGGRVVVDEPAKEWAGKSDLRREHDKDPLPSAGDEKYSPENPFGLSTAKERERFFKDLPQPKFNDLRDLKEKVYRSCFDRASKERKFCWGVEKDQMEEVEHEPLHKDFAPKVKTLLADARAAREEAAKAGDQRARKTTVGLTSAYRTASLQLDLWSGRFLQYLYQGVPVPIQGPKDPRILEGGAKFRIDERALATVRTALELRELVIDEHLGTVDYEIRWQKAAKRGNAYEDCKLDVATHVMITNLALMRLMTGGLLGEKAVQYFASFFGSRTATPGFSRHQQGIAVDLAPPEPGMSNKFSRPAKRKWAGSWLFEWLKASATGYGLKNYDKEPWHWEDLSAPK